MFGPSINVRSLPSQAFDEYVNTAAARLRFLQAIAVTQAGFQVRQAFEAFWDLRGSSRGV